MLVAGAVLLFKLQAPAVPSADIWGRCGSSLIVLVIALLLALCIGVFVGLRARQMGPRMERFIALLGLSLIHI